MPAWIGNVIGSAIGLVALLLGAMYNAKLGRKRDERNMSDERKSISAAIGAEMAVYVETLCGRMTQAYAGPNGRSRAMLDTLYQPIPAVWPRLAEKVGVLDYEIAYETVRRWAMLEFHASQLAATIAEMQEGLWDVRKAKQRIDNLKLDLPPTCSLIHRLTQHSAPDLQYALP